MPDHPSSTTRLATAARARLPHVPALGRWRITGKSVLAIILLDIIAAPFMEHSAAGLVFESITSTLVLCLGVLAVGGKTRTLIIAMALAVPAVTAKWLNFLNPSWCLPEVYLTFGIPTVGYVVWHFLRYIMLARRVDSDVLCTGIATFLLLALLWAFVYQLIELQVPGSFICTVASQPPHEMKGLFAAYFSLVTLCTVGFGDIVPVSDVARMCAMLEGATGVFFVAVLISRLVSLYTVESQAQHADEDSHASAAPPPPR